MYKKRINFIITTMCMIFFESITLIYIFKVDNLLGTFLIVTNLMIYLVTIYVIEYSISRSTLKKWLILWSFINLVIFLSHNIFGVISLITTYNDIFISVLNYILSITLGLISIYIAVHISNLNKKKIYRELFIELKQIIDTLNSMKTLFKLLESNRTQDYVNFLGKSEMLKLYSPEKIREIFEKNFRDKCLTDFENSWSNINNLIYEVRGKVYGVPEYISVFEHLSSTFFDEEKIEQYTKNLKKTIRWIDIVLEENNIYGFTYLHYDDSNRHTFIHRRNLKGIINGISIKTDHTASPAKYEFKTTKKMNDLKKEYDSNPTDQKVKKALLREYKKNVSIFHYDKKRKKHIKQ